LKNRRLVGFIFAILLGLGAGLFFGWAVHPAGAVNTTLDSMRSDYQADFVLMVAKAYPAQADLPEAVKLLQQLDAKNPLQAVQRGLLAAQQLGYSEVDLRSIADLEMRLTQSGGTP
jgi:hypothetical protein